MPRKYAMWIIGIGTTIVVLLVALIVVVATDDGTPEAAVTSTTSAEAATTTTAAITTTAAATTTTGAITTTAAATTTTATTTTVAATTTTPPPGPVCVDVGPMPAGAAQISSRAGDYDGDGLPDDFFAYRLGGDWFMWSHLSDGDYRLVTEINLPWSFAHWTGSPIGPLTVQGSRTLGDPRQAVVVGIYQGLGRSYAIFGIEDCEIVPFTQDDGIIPDLWQIGSPAHTDFPVCDVPDPSVRQVVLSCFDMSICPDFDTTVDAYAVSRDPARLILVDSYTETTPRPVYLQMLDDSCLD